jgi:hypothetical protein
LYSGSHQNDERHDSHKNAVSKCALPFFMGRLIGIGNILGLCVLGCTISPDPDGINAFGKLRELMLLALQENSSIFPFLQPHFVRVFIRR